jgi:hypothetical protein
MEKRISIKEAASISGLTLTTLYRYVNNKKLTCFNMKKHGKIVKEIDLKQLEELLGKNLLITDNNMEKQVNNSYSHVNTLTIENLNEAIHQAIEQQQKVLTKPLEEQAMYIAGALTKENEFLRQQVETLRIENDQLRENMKALPMDDLTEENEKLKEDLSWEMEQKKKLQEQISILPDSPLNVNKILMQNADNINLLHKEKEEIQKELQVEQEEKNKKQYKVIYLEEELKKSEQEKIDLTAAWKKELEEARRPWWRFW